jgi:hypothetical protein
MDITEVQDDIKLFASIEALGNLEGGKKLIDTLEKDVVSSVDTLVSTYKTAQDIEIRTVIAELSSKLSLLRVLNRSGKNKEMAQDELKKILGE